MAELDSVIHQPIRLKIMAALNACPDGEFIDFVALKAIVGATDGNLGAHLGTLKTAGHVAIEKDFVGKNRVPGYNSPARAGAGLRSMSNSCGVFWTVPPPEPVSLPLL
ncbi:transcriptional regulator [Candidatus Aalborgicola defluviihabitans]|uniref:transcriptional regulator n=1 Tax=Candidatus Aalborgicola defluviihabitans TaxID=3386187 RepID=UPI0039B8EBBC